ncbi:MAG: hypothetical protein ACR2G3_02825 [Solirubrobacterales bacterium]
MSGARIAVVGGALVAAVALLVVMSGGEDDDPAATATEIASNASEKPERDKPPDDEPRLEAPVIEVEDGKPVGELQRLYFQAGERIALVVSSDTGMDLHLHGYDVEQSVVAGGTTKFDVPADIEGVFELEGHDLATPIAEITVSPG